MSSRAGLPDLDTLNQDALKALILAQQRRLGVQEEEILAQRQQLQTKDEQLAWRQAEIELKCYLTRQSAKVRRF